MNDSINARRTSRGLLSRSTSRIHKSFRGLVTEYLLLNEQMRAQWPHWARPARVTTFETFSTLIERVPPYSASTSKGRFFFCSFIFCIFHVLQTTDEAEHFNRSLKYRWFHFYTVGIVVPNFVRLLPFPDVIGVCFSVWRAFSYTAIAKWWHFVFHITVPFYKIHEYVHLHSLWNVPTWQCWLLLYSQIPVNLIQCLKRKNWM